MQILFSGGIRSAIPTTSPAFGSNKTADTKESNGLEASKRSMAKLEAYLDDINQKLDAGKPTAIKTHKKAK